MSQPYLSVVIPAFNEASALPQCLSSLQAQTACPTFEIIVVDNNSSDATARIAKSFGVKVITEKTPGVCAARNAGLQVAKGEIIVSTDADCDYPADWLKQISQVFSQQPDVSLLVGNYRFSAAPKWANPSLKAYEWLCLQVNYAFGWHGYVSAANLAFRRTAFKGYDETLTQGGDELYVLKKLKQNGRVLYRFANPITTSSRRLQQGFTKTFFGDFVGAYLFNYLRTRLTGQNKMGTYKAHRKTESAKNNELHIGAYVSFLLSLLFFTAVIYFGGNLLLNLIPNMAVRFGALFALMIGILSYATFNPHAQLAGPQPFRVRTKRPVVALTFDDGPNGSYSLAIAEHIEQAGGRASFFQVGQNIQRDPATTLELHNRGHLIGNHSYNHSFADFFKSNWQENIKQTSAEIKNATGQAPYFVRLPWLFRLPWLLAPLYAMGLQPVAGTFVSLPEFRQPDGVTMARRFAQKVKAGDILILHDGYNASGGNRSETVKAVAELCQLLTDRGFSFVRVDELL